MRRARSVENPELALLAEATQLLSTAQKPERALKPLVSLVKERMSTDVCSLYLLEPAGTDLVLAATDGLAQTSVGQVRMHPSEGLTGLVAEAKVPVSVPEAARHPRYRYFPETGEERYHSFLGVPLLRTGAVQGVLVVQNRDARDFSRDEVRMLAAVAAQLAGLLNQEKAKAPASARVLPRSILFPALAATVTAAEEVEGALSAKAQALYARSELGHEPLRAISAAAPGTTLLLSCESAELELLAAALRESAWRSPLRFAVAGVFEVAELREARSCVLRGAGAGADVTLGACIDTAAAALSVQGLASAADFFLFDTTALTSSCTAGRSQDPYVPAVFRLLARALHAARDAGRPSFVVGELTTTPEGWLASAGLGADVLVVPASSIAAVRRFSRRVAPGAAADVARSALRAHSASHVRETLTAYVTAPSAG